MLAFFLLFCLEGLRHGSRISNFGDRVSGFGFRVSGFGLSGEDFAIRDSGSGIRVSGFDIQVSGFGKRHLFGPLGEVAALAARQVQDRVFRLHRPEEKNRQI